MTILSSSCNAFSCRNIIFSKYNHSTFYMSLNSKSSAAKLSIISNASLTIFKIVAGLLTGAVSILAEAIHSGIDLVASFIALYAVKAASKPQDEDHQYGHGKIENMSGLIEAVLIFIAALWIIYESIQKLLHPHPIEQPMIGVLIMALSAVLNFFVSREIFRVAEEHDSEALRADAWHLKTDVYTSVGVLGALAITWIGGKFLPSSHLAWLDPVCAILVALLIIKVSYDLICSSGRDLLDARLPQEQLCQLKNLLAQQTQPVCGYHKLRTRKSGSTSFIDLHLELQSTLTLDEAKNICENVESQIIKLFPRASVTIHPEPFTEIKKKPWIRGKE